MTTPARAGVTLRAKRATGRPARPLPVAGAKQGRGQMADQVSPRFASLVEELQLLVLAPQRSLNVGPGTPMPASQM